jgi:hypothetical protein
MAETSMETVRPISLISAWSFPLGAMSVEHFTTVIQAKDAGRPFFGRFARHRIDLTVKMADLVS